MHVFTHRNILFYWILKIINKKLTCMFATLEGSDRL